MKKVLFCVVLLVIIVTLSCSIFQDGELSRNRMIVAFEIGYTGATIQNVLEVRGIEMIDHLRLISGVSCYLGKSEIDWLERSGLVRYIEPDYRVSILDSGTPGALVVGEEVTPSGEIIDWGMVRIRAEAAWEIATGKGVKIGVVDTGIDTDHPDLVGAVLGGVNLVDGGSYEDDNNHGTYISTVIAARRNGVGIVGVAPEAMLYSIKVLDYRGSGYMSDIIEGFQWALDMDLKAMNCSLGSYWASTAMQEAMKAVHDDGACTIAATGNDGRSIVCYPARYHPAICVGASGQSGAPDARVSWSNYGSDFERDGVLAPGEAVLAGNKSGGWQRVSGTSISTPHVTGIIALLNERKWCLRKFIFDTASLGGNPNREQGHGLVDVRATLDEQTRAAEELGIKLELGVADE